MQNVALSHGKARVLSLALLATVTVGYALLRPRARPLAVANAPAPTTPAHFTPLPSSAAPMDSAALRIAALEALRPSAGLAGPTIETNPKHPSQTRRERPVAASDTFAVKKAAASSSSSEEARLLLDAHQKLALGEPTEALSQLNEHSRRFPSSSMRQEREAATIVAHCHRGANAEALRLWQAFIKRWPTSPFGERIQGACHW